jgi:hypothetical protein
LTRSDDTEEGAILGRPSIARERAVARSHWPQEAQRAEAPTGLARLFLPEEEYLRTITGAFIGLSPRTGYRMGGHGYT